MLLLGTVLLLAFSVLARLDWAEGPDGWDVELTAWVRSWAAPGLAELMWAVSWPGWSPQNWIIVVAICGTLIVRGVRLGGLLLLVATLAHLLVRGIKSAIGRLRPDSALDGGPMDPSFPSGHAAQYTIFLGLLAYLAWTRLEAGWRRTAAVGLCLGMIMMVGPSRVYLGHHWPSDVLAGYLLGAGAVLVLLAALGWRRADGRR